MLFLTTLVALVPQVHVQGRASVDPVRVPPPPPPNVLVILLDDVGVDMVGIYDEAPVQEPCTPNIDDLASSGLMFRNAWTNPWCSPSRAQLLTGRHAFRTGIGIFIDPFGASPGLDLSETVLPEALPGYSSSIAGKWHLANPFDNGDGQGLDHPRNSGFGWHAGSLFNPKDGFIGPCCPPGCSAGQSFNYYDWVKTTNGVEACTNKYMTIDTTDDAIARAQVMAEPWFLFVSYNACHVPKHSPPAALCQGLCSNPPYKCPTAPGDDHPTQNKAVMQALDSEIGRLIRRVQLLNPNVWVFLLGDNGTTEGAAEGPLGGCFGFDHLKGTPYEGGINVPFIVYGPGIQPAEITALVSSTDVFATVMELCGGSVFPEDSVSFLPYLLGDPTPLRQTVYAERFQPNGLPLALDDHQRAIRNGQFKLIRRTDYTVSPPLVTDELYDLWIDPCETSDLLDMPLSPTASANYQALIAELVAMGVG